MSTLSFDQVHYRKVEEIWLCFGTGAAFKYVLGKYNYEKALDRLKLTYAQSPRVRDLVHRSPSEYEALASLFPMACPERGEFIAYKKGWSHYCPYDNYEPPYPYFVIITLKIPADAKRSSAFGRKCRASKAQIIRIERIEQKGEFTKPLECVYSLRDPSFVYSVGEMVKPIGKQFDENRFHECTSGIHFFMTKQEAIDY